MSFDHCYYCKLDDSLLQRRNAKKVAKNPEVVLITNAIAARIVPKMSLQRVQQI
jgi:hypothetical protein